MKTRIITNGTYYKVQFKSLFGWVTYKSYTNLYQGDDIMFYSKEEAQIYIDNLKRASNDWRVCE